MSEVTSLHEDDWRPRPSRVPALTPIRDEEWSRHSPRSPRTWEQEPVQEPPRGGWGSGRPRARSVDALDDMNRPGSTESGRSSPPSSSGRRGRGYAPPRSRSRDDLYHPSDPRDLPHSRDPHYYDDFRPRDRRADPRSRQRPRDPRDADFRSRDPQYDGRLLEEALKKKGSGERRRLYQEEEEEDHYPPAPPPYSETESQASRERRMKKVSQAPPTSALPDPSAPACPVDTFFFSPLQNLALSRESLVV